MKTIAIGACMLLAGVAVPVYAKADLWESLNAQAFTYLKQERYPDAIKTAEESVRAAVELYGPETEKVAVAFTNLSLFHRLEGDYRKAEQYVNMAMTIRINLVGENHPSIADL